MSAMMLMPMRTITAVTNPDGSLGTKARRTRAIAAMGCTPISTTRPQHGAAEGEACDAVTRTAVTSWTIAKIIKIIRVTTTLTNIGR